MQQYRESRQLGRLSKQQEEKLFGSPESNTDSLDSLADCLDWKTNCLAVQTAIQTV